MSFSYLHNMQFHSLIMYVDLSNRPYNFYSCVKCKQVLMCESEFGTDIAIKTRNYLAQEHKNANWRVCKNTGSQVFT